MDCLLQRALPNLPSVKVPGEHRNHSLCDQSCVTREYKTQTTLLEWFGLQLPRVVALGGGKQAGGIQQTAVSHSQHERKDAKQNRKPLLKL